MRTYRRFWNAGYTVGDVLAIVQVERTTAGRLQPGDHFHLDQGGRPVQYTVAWCEPAWNAPESTRVVTECNRSMALCPSMPVQRVTGNHEIGTLV